MLFLLLAGAAAAAPTKITKSGSTLSLVAGAGQTNDFDVDLDSGRLLVREKTLNQITVDPASGGNAGCLVYYAQAVSCSATGITSFSMDTGDMNDVVDVDYTTIPFTITGGAGDDKLEGDSGADTIDAGAGRDYVYGDAGNDQLEGGAGDDRLYGEGDDDTLRDAASGSDSDYLSGSSGNDTLKAKDGDGLDSLYCSSGTADGQSSDSSDYRSSCELQASDTGTPDPGGTPGPVPTKITKSGSRLSLVAAAGQANDFDVELNSGRLFVADKKLNAITFDPLTTGGAAGCMTIVAHTVSCTATGITSFSIDTGDMNDVVDVDYTTIPFSITGGTGDDRLEGDSGADTIDAGSGKDYAYGDAGNDQLEGGTGDDRLYGETGDDTLSDAASGSDSDYLSGSSGNDTLKAKDGDSLDKLYCSSGTADGQSSDSGDSLSACELQVSEEPVTSGPGYAWVDGNSNLIVQADTAEDNQFVVWGGMRYNEAGQQTSGPYVYVTDKSGWFLDAGNLCTDVDSLAPNGDIPDTDTVECPNWINSIIIYTGDGNDSTRVTWGRFSHKIPNYPMTVYGGPGNDSLQGSVIYNTFYGEDGRDQIEAPPVFSSCAGIAGNCRPGSSVFGGSGNDYIVGGPVRDNISGDAGADAIYGQDGDDVLVGNAENDSIDAGNGNDLLYGSDGNDGLIGGTGYDTVYGEAGNDAMSGGDHPDTLDGGDGNDTIQGWTGDDYIDGGNGDDPINGGSNTDTIHAGPNSDTSVTGGSGADFVLGDDGNDVLQGGNAAGDGSSDWVEGGPGDDYLYGGPGGDKLPGNSGSDHIYGYGGNDTLWGEAPGVLGNTRDYLFGGNDHDESHGGEAADYIYDDNGQDRLFGWGADDEIISTDSSYPEGSNWNKGYDDLVDCMGGSDYFERDKSDDTRNCERDNSSDQVNPVVMIHGIDVLGTPGADCTIWANFINYVMNKNGFIPFSGVGYYHNDKNCLGIDTNGGSWWDATIGNYGDHSKHFGGASSHKPTAASHDRSTPIEHLGYHFAWFIYNRYNSKGQTVDTVGHSMGGLITRYAIMMSARKLAGYADAQDFPPGLNVDDAVTAETPHGGAPNAQFCSTNKQCQEMTPGSPFLSNLASTPLPQGVGGTDWTAMGAINDAVVPFGSATAGVGAGAAGASTFNPQHMALYGTPPDYGHVQNWPPNDTSDAFDAKAWYSDAAEPGRMFESTRLPRGARWIFEALRSGKW